MDGVIVVNKPAGFTSHDVVAKLRQILNTKKIGHTGTLDPDATGVLLVMVGKATKALPFIEDIDKTYIAELVLGNTTFTDDIYGEVLASQQIKPIADFQQVLDTFKGKSQQLPPMVSSIKVNGKKLYEYARNHQPVERVARFIEIYDIKVLDSDKLQFEVHCSSGTYIRSLCVDIAAKTGNLGCMGHLIRNKVGRFDISMASNLDMISNGDYQIHPVLSLLSHFKQVQYDKIEEVYQGKKIKLDCDEQRVLIVFENQAIAVYEREKADVFRCVRGLW